MELQRVTPDDFGLPECDIARHDFMRLQNAQRIGRRFRWRPPRFRARSAGTFPPQKFERIAADVAVIPLDLQRACVRFFYINWSHSKIIGFFTETVYIIANFMKQIKHFI